MGKKAKKLTKSPSPPSSSGALGGARAVPYEDFEVDEVKAKRHTRSTPEGATHPSTTYEILADGCDYKGLVSNLEDWARIRRLTPKCQVYQDILEYVRKSENHAEPVPNWGYLGNRSKVQVKHIYKVERAGERFPFTEPVRMMLWHATRPSCLPGILERGLQSANVGRAIYFADRFAKSQWYATPSSKGRKFFILAEVAPGSMAKCPSSWYNFHLQQRGYNSSKFKGTHIPDPKYNRMYHGAVMPCGPTIQGKHQKNRWGLYSEFLIFDPQRAIVRFIVEC